MGISLCKYCKGVSCERFKLLECVVCVVDVPVEKMFLF